MSASKGFRDLLVDSFTIKRKNRTADGQGGASVMATTIAIVIGRLRPVRPREQIAAGNWEAIVTHVLYIEAPAPATILRDDQVEGVGKILRVIAVREPSHITHHLEIDLEEVIPPISIV